MLYVEYKQHCFACLMFMMVKMMGQESDGCCEIAIQLNCSMNQTSHKALFSQCEPVK